MSSLALQLYNYFMGTGQHEQAKRQAEAMRYQAFIRSGQPGSLSHLPYGVARAVQKLQFEEQEKGQKSPEYLSALIELGGSLEAHKMVKEAHDTYLDCIDLIKSFGYSKDHPSATLCHEALSRTQA